jgi:hypothetical protein
MPRRREPIAVASMLMGSVDAKDGRLIGIPSIGHALFAIRMLRAVTSHK